MPETPDNRTTSLLFIDSHVFHRLYWAHELRRCAYGYEIVEASDMRSGLDQYRSRRFECVVLELALPNQEGFKTLVELVPIARRPKIAVVVLTVLTQQGLWELARNNGAYACLAKEHTSGAELHRAIQCGRVFVAQNSKQVRRNI